MQVYANPANSKFGGLDIANDDPVSLLIVTTEQLSGECRAVCAAQFGRKAAGRAECRHRRDNRYR